MTRRSRAAAGLACVLVVALAACSDGEGGDPADGGDTPSAPASATASATPTGPAGPPPAPATGTPSVGVSTLPAVGVGDPAQLTEGVRVTVSSVRKVRIEASGPGEVSGPGVTVTVDVRNGGSAPVDLTGFAVTATYGQDVPAPPAGSGADALAGPLPPGGSDSGRYTFAVPERETGTVEVQVSSDAAEDVAVFQN